MNPTRKSVRNEWKNRLEQYRSSGKPILAWCKDQGIPYQTFYYWHKRLDITKDSEKPLAPKQEVNPFLEILDPINEQSGLIIEFKGVKIHLSKKFDPSTLTECLQVLRGIPC